MNRMAMRRWFIRLGMSASCVFGPQLTEIRNAVAQDEVADVAEVVMQPVQGFDVYPNTGSPEVIESVRQRHTVYVQRMIAELDRVCHLDDEQRKKLTVAGKGVVEEIIANLRKSMEPPVPADPAEEAPQPVAGGINLEAVEARIDLNGVNQQLAVRRRFRGQAELVVNLLDVGGPFQPHQSLPVDDNKLWQETVDELLTAEQRTRLADFVNRRLNRQRIAYRQRVLDAMEQVWWLSDEQAEDVAALIGKSLPDAAKIDVNEMSVASELTAKSAYAGPQDVMQYLQDLHDNGLVAILAESQVENWEIDRQQIVAMLQSNAQVRVWNAWQGPVPMAVPAAQFIPALPLVPAAPVVVPEPGVAQ
ncbi:MAG: hypothetical protein R3E01_20085 [Pirellulaceae bacterium]|nr:hypothetical protein [Planctomycetales bacterium]